MLNSNFTREQNLKWVTYNLFSFKCMAEVKTLLKQRSFVQLPPPPQEKTTTMFPHLTLHLVQGDDYLPSQTLYSPLTLARPFIHRLTVNKIWTAIKYAKVSLLGRLSMLLLCPIWITGIVHHFISACFMSRNVINASFRSGTWSES